MLRCARVPKPPRWSVLPLPNKPDHDKYLADEHPWNRRCEWIPLSQNQNLFAPFPSEWLHGGGQSRCYRDKASASSCLSIFPWNDVRFLYSRVLYSNNKNLIQSPSFFWIRSNASAAINSTAALAAVKIVQRSLAKKILLLRKAALNNLPRCLLLRLPA